MYNLPVENLDDSQIQKSSLLGIFSNDDQKVLDQQLNTFKKPEYELLIKKITLILIGSASGLLSPKAAEILSDTKFIKSIFLMNPDINRLKTILKYELDTRCLRSNDEKLRLNLMPYDELKSRYYDMERKLQIANEKLAIMESTDVKKSNVLKDFISKIKTNEDTRDINLARFDHTEYKDKIVEESYNPETKKMYYGVNNPIDMKFFDLDKGIVSSVKSWDRKMSFYRYSILDKDEDFMPFIMPDPKDNFFIEDGDYMVMFNNENIELDEIGFPANQDDEIMMRDKFLAILNSKN